MPAFKVGDIVTYRGIEHEITSVFHVPHKFEYRLDLREKLRPQVLMMGVSEFDPDLTQHTPLASVPQKPYVPADPMGTKTRLTPFTLAGKSEPICQCDVRDLLSTGHKASCAYKAMRSEIDRWMKK